MLTANQPFTQTQRRTTTGLKTIAARVRAQLLALPDPEKCVVHTDIWPPNVMMDDDLRVTGLIDFSSTTRIGDTLMDLLGAAHFNCVGKGPVAIE